MGSWLALSEGPVHKGGRLSRRVFIGWLRAKIENNLAAPAIVRTEAGIGYRFSEERGGTVQAAGER